jgi:hypothetical protein
MALFRGKFSGNESPASGARLTRHSSGWSTLGALLRGQESLRVLDFGPTSAGNINLITGLGHSIYMSNLVQDAARPEYLLKDDDGSECFAVDRFLTENLELQGRTFDVVTLWDTLDYLPAALVQPTVDRLASVIAPGGALLAFFHSKATGDDTQFSRYHLTTGDTLEIHRSGDYPLLQTWSNRQVEVMFADFAGYKFFLAKDSLREVIVTR